MWEKIPTEKLKIAWIASHGKIDSWVQYGNEKVDNEIKKVRQTMISQANVAEEKEGNDDVARLLEFWHKKFGQEGREALIRRCKKLQIPFSSDQVESLLKNCMQCNPRRAKEIEAVIPHRLQQNRGCFEMWQIDYIGPMKGRGYSGICSGRN